MQLDAAGPIVVKLIVDKAATQLAGLGQLPTNKALELPDFTIGLEPKARDIVQLLESGGSSNLLLLHGMAGLGKTTLAKSVFNHLHATDNTTPCHFAWLNPEMKASQDVVPAQRALLEELAHEVSPVIPSAAVGRRMLEAKLRGKKVLLVVDNVWGQQLSWLLPGSIMDVLGEGSVVLVTSRESWAMEQFGWTAAVHEIEMDFLAPQESLELFCSHIYGSSMYPAGDDEAVAAIVGRCGGLPLALEVVGRYLHDGKDVWSFFRHLEEALSFVYSNERALRFERQQTVYDALSVSWDALDLEQQQTLLDIVWFLQGQPLQLVESVCGPGVLERLKQLGLVKWTTLPEDESSQQPVTVHVVLADFCKLLGTRSNHGTRLELLGQDVKGCGFAESTENILSMVCVASRCTLIRSRNVSHHHHVLLAPGE
jgi:hypothetical protein